jgi:hypothetical protein
MDFHVYYKAWPHGGLHCVEALVCDSSEEAINEVGALLLES